MFVAPVGNFRRGFLGTEHRSRICFQQFRARTASRRMSVKSSVETTPSIPGNDSCSISVLARLLNRARETREDHQTLVTIYASERFLYPPGNSPVRDRFVLEGAMLRDTLVIVTQKES
jgi:hypothetical protein